VTILLAAANVSDIHRDTLVPHYVANMKKMNIREHQRDNKKSIPFKEAQTRFSCKIYLRTTYIYV